MITRYHGGDATLAQIREWSGTSQSGSTMLGIQQAGVKLGLKGSGFEAELDHLKVINKPVILHVINDQNMAHFIVCFGYDRQEDLFEIGDPAAIDIKRMTSPQLMSIWKSQALLMLKPTPLFKPVKPKRTGLNQLRWVYEFAKPDINLLFISLAIGVFISLLGLSVAVFTQKLVDQILPDKNLLKLSVGSGLLLFLLLLRAGLSYIRQLFLSRQSRDFNTRILASFYSTLLRLPKSFFDSRKTGELISRMNDTTRIQQTVAHVCTNIAIELVVLIMSLIGLLYYHIPLGLITLMWLPIFAWLVYRFQRSLIWRQREVMVAAAVNEGNFIDTIQGIGTIKGTHKESLFIDRTHDVYSFLQDRRFHLGLISNRFNIWTQVVSAMFIVGLLFYGSRLVLQDILTIGILMAVIQLISMAMLSASQLAMINIELQEAKVALDRMQEFTQLDPEIDIIAEAQKIQIDRFESLTLKDLSFRFTGRPLLLKGINLHLMRGEIILIQGESGGGKSTLLQILQRFYTPEQGEILVNTLPMESFAVSAWRRIISVVPQQVKLFNGSLYENILLGPMEESSVAHIISFFKKYSFDQYFKKLPQGYDTQLGEAGVNISGGQQQLVGLARALYHRPQLLLLDEATSAMDQSMEDWVMTVLQSLKSEMGIIIVSHRGGLFEITDRVYRL